MEKLRIKENKAIDFIALYSKIPKEHLKERILLRLEALGFFFNDINLVSNITIDSLIRKTTKDYKYLIENLFFKGEINRETYEIVGAIFLEKISHLKQTLFYELIKEIHKEALNIILDWDIEKGYKTLTGYTFQTENYDFDLNIIAENSCGEQTIQIEINTLRKNETEVIIKDEYLTKICKAIKSIITLE